MTANSSKTIWTVALIGGGGYIVWKYVLPRFKKKPTGGSGPSGPASPPGAYAPQNPDFPSGPSFSGSGGVGGPGSGSANQGQPFGSAYGQQQLTFQQDLQTGFNPDGSLMGNEPNPDLAGDTLFNFSQADQPQFNSSDQIAPGDTSSLSSLLDNFLNSIATSVPSNSSSLPDGSIVSNTQVNDLISDQDYSPGFATVTDDGQDSSVAFNANYSGNYGGDNGEDSGTGEVSGDNSGGNDTGDGDSGTFEDASAGEGDDTGDDA